MEQRRRHHKSIDPDRIARFVPGKLLPAAVAATALSACGPPDWTEPLTEEEYAIVADLIEEGNESTPFLNGLIEASDESVFNDSVSNNELCSMVDEGASDLWLFLEQGRIVAYRTEDLPFSKQDKADSSAFFFARWNRRGENTYIALNRDHRDDWDYTDVFHEIMHQFPGVHNHESIGDMSQEEYLALLRKTKDVAMFTTQLYISYSSYLIGDGIETFVTRELSAAIGDYGEMEGVAAKAEELLSWSEEEWVEFAADAFRSGCYFCEPLGISEEEIQDIIHEGGYYERYRDYVQEQRDEIMGAREDSEEGEAGRKQGESAVRKGRRLPSIERKWR